MDLPNLTYKPPIHGKDRAQFLGNAMAVLMPTRYVEPFGGVTVEAQLCGTPVIGSSYGSFTETIKHGVTGFTCRTLGDYLSALEKIEEGFLERSTIRNVAVDRYDMYKLANDYDNVFQQVSDVRKGAGWYSTRSKIGEVKKSI